MEPSEQTAPSIRMKYSKDAGEYTFLVTRDVELYLTRELHEAGVLPLHELRETAAVAGDVLLTIGGMSSVITIVDAIRRVLGATPGKRIHITLANNAEIDATNYSRRDLEKLIERLKD